jgi:hypothetical protein
MPKTKPPKIVKEGKSKVGDYVITGITQIPRPRTTNFFDKAHIAVVDHLYGHSGEMRYVQAICGRKAGRATGAGNPDVCALCLKEAERRGIVLPL